MKPMGPKSWFMIYIVIIIIFALIMLYIATKKEKILYNSENGADKLIIVEGWRDINE